MRPAVLQPMPELRHDVGKSSAETMPHVDRRHRGEAAAQHRARGAPPHRRPACRPAGRRRRRVALAAAAAWRRWGLVRVRVGLG